MAKTFPTQVRRALVGGKLDDSVSLSIAEEELRRSDIATGDGLYLMSAVHLFTPQAHASHPGLNNRQIHNRKLFLTFPINGLAQIISQVCPRNVGFLFTAPPLQHPLSPSPFPHPFSGCRPSRTTLALADDGFHGGSNTNSLLNLGIIIRSGSHRLMIYGSPAGSFRERIGPIPCAT
ncbi:hypothetical protein PCH_Pc24g01690 [Penicillium rubens Wisconsin 54-1255]|uniref:Uncharacterized protein n=1 Tax=Penicillium rubens (strain ATCC 28089 / DSM 1075 / NRRL 1951 / Wisconsin 54-1255) TaxID=500485 RepID=B6HWV8_PENRW|nr:hypothetical protein PCH_Pc24g01690 [Penicillium rubens Wisconsin 54-1255]